MSDLKSRKRKTESDVPDNYPKVKLNTTCAITPIKISLTPQPKEKVTGNPKDANTKLREVFNSDDESEEEDIPVEARIRMRNIGRETPTSSGPNSFGKGKFGFTNRTAISNKISEHFHKLENGP